MEIFSLDASDRFAKRIEGFLPKRIEPKVSVYTTKSEGCSVAVVIYVFYKTDCVKHKNIVSEVIRLPRGGNAMASRAMIAGFYRLVRKIELIGRIKLDDYYEEGERRI